MDTAGTSLTGLLAYADLELDDARRSALAPMLEQVRASIAVIRSIDVGELPPATAFDARWE